MNGEPDFSKFQPINHDTVAVAGVPVPLPVVKAGQAFLAEIVCEQAPIRYWKDASLIAPTGAQGILAGVGGTFYLWTVEITLFRAISLAASTLQVTYYIRRVGLRAVEHA